MKEDIFYLHATRALSGNEFCDLTWCKHKFEGEQSCATKYESPRDKQREGCIGLIMHAQSGTLGSWFAYLYNVDVGLGGCCCMGSGVLAMSFIDNVSVGAAVADVVSYVQLVVFKCGGWLCVTRSICFPRARLSFTATSHCVLHIAPLCVLGFLLVGYAAHANNIAMNDAQTAS